MTIESKFETGAVEPPLDAGELPWGYGHDRITALVRSPDSLYVYWEITDDAIARAKKRLGAAGDGGWCNLRVYDTTGREFDGTNANGYFDVSVDRATRDWFFDLRKPTAAFHVEVGIKTHEGFFQAIARSGRAELPRKGPSPNRALSWRTITSEHVHPAAVPYRSKHVPSASQLAARSGVDARFGGALTPEEYAARLEREALGASGLWSIGASESSFGAASESLIGSSASLHGWR